MQLKTDFKKDKKIIIEVNKQKKALFKYNK